ncbi:hypothetical protein PR001_g30970 [Phytophthora rubi]|uniref:DDE Tnp4 domain-containing protein n=1 Tax=Phytophthora rubi TaxID=129364 RepID=A0A6A3GS01_9STRA|nr:hypothetical protein PR002_g30950 [Phytophthora rubi]KAE8958688.1 hypothetical protein PR001_g30970 [Phytophthora rubi]
MGAVVEHDADFEQRVDAVGKKGLTPLQKCSAAIRMLVYGCAADSLDDVVKDAESTLLAYTKKICRTVVEVFEEEYLREPTRDDIERQLERSAARGLPGCLGSLDCMHWVWEMCPTALKGQLSGKEGKPTVVLEVFSKWLQINACGSSTSSLAAQDPIMTSILLTDHL